MGVSHIYTGFQCFISTHNGWFWAVLKISDYISSAYLLMDFNGSFRPVMVYFSYIFHQTWRKHCWKWHCKSLSGKYICILVFYNFGDNWVIDIEQIWGSLHCKVCSFLVFHFLVDDDVWDFVIIWWMLGFAILFVLPILVCTNWWWLDVV